MKDLFNIKNKVVVITGAAGLIGKEYSKYLLANGAKIVMIDNDEKKLERVAKNIEKKFNISVARAVIDITNEDEIEILTKVIKAKYKKVDVLINNAGISGRVNKDKVILFDEYPLPDWKAAMDINITGMFLCSKHLSKLMNPGSVIINVASTYGIDGVDQRIYNNFVKPPAYSASKGAVIAFTKYLAGYFGNKIRVNTLSPGGVYEDSQDMQFIKNYCNKTMLGRMAKPNEYVGAMHFLISDASKYMTGANLVVDGGWTAW